MWTPDQKARQRTNNEQRHDGNARFPFSQSIQSLLSLFSMFPFPSLCSSSLPQPIIIHILHANGITCRYVQEQPFRSTEILR